MQYTNPYIEICIEGPSSVFRGLAQTEKELMDRNHILSDYRKGDIIITGGTKQKGLIVLASGMAKVYAFGAGNREQIIKLVRPPDMINYRVLFSDGINPFTVKAIENSVIVSFERSLLSKILKQNSDLAVRILKTMSEDLHNSYERIISLTQKHVRGRLAESVLLLRDVFGLDADGRTIKAQLSRDDLAHLSNMTTSNAIRTLSNLASEKILEIEGRRIRILSVQMLEEISKSGQ